MRCGQPVTVPGVFSAVSTDTGHTCQRAAGHEGVHRWQPRWEGVSPAEVEADIARDLAAWEPSDDDEQAED
ncbi:MAG TPA: hypothetical protein VNA20_10310 [Frankiaceae bacterium]|nr:hypothetical protein [Frankiaceae bacterium]